MTMPLQGIRVIDTTRWAYGPYAARCLADMGADVIKVEDPVTGDGSRWTHKSRDIDIGGDKKMNALFELLNKGKKGIALDLGKEKGREVLYDLVRKSDVFMTSNLPRSRKKLGIEYETLIALNPRLVYALCSAWGDEGPRREDMAWDGAAFARSGIMHIMGEKNGPPPECPVGMGDLVSSVTMAYGVTLALLHRETTGKGQKVEVSLFGTMVKILTAMTQQISLDADQDYPQKSREHIANPLNNTYQTRDGRWLLLNMHQSDPYWHRFCEAAGIQKLELDARFKNHLARCDHADELCTILDETFSQKQLAEWEAIFAKLNLPWAPVKTLKEVWTDPQVAANQFITDFEHPLFGLKKTVSYPVRLGDADPIKDCAAPELGQHTEEVLLELGCSWEEIGKLKDEKIIL